MEGGAGAGDDGEVGGGVADVRDNEENKKVSGESEAKDNYEKEEKGEQTTRVREEIRPLCQSSNSLLASHPLLIMHRSRPAPSHPLSIIHPLASSSA